MAEGAASYCVACHQYCTHKPKDRLSCLPPQVYYELAAERARQGKQGEVAIIRIEQLVRHEGFVVCLGAISDQSLWC